MKKRMTIMVIALLIVFGGVFGWDALRSYFMGQFFAHFQPPPATISSATAQNEKWQYTLKTVGTLLAVNGVTISPEVAGVVTEITFNSGDMVQQGQLLVKIDDSIDQANLKSAKAALTLAQISFERTETLYNRKVASASDYDTAKATLEQDQANVAGIKALIAQKNIVAPFAGKIGIRQINLGQYVSPGTPLVNLQAISPIYINFYLPEQYLPNLSLGQTVNAQVDTYPKEVFVGQISAIDSQADTSTHNILVQATFPNTDQKLYPGIFANIEVVEPQSNDVVTLPNTAITYSLFGNTVFLIENPDKPEKTADGQTVYVVKQQFVTLGEQTGNKVVVTSGITADQQVVSSGQLKLENGARVVINNSVTLDQKQNEIY